MSQESRIMLAELLLAEKEDTRRWLRTEMDRLVDPMLDSLFDRIETKLTNGMKQNESSDGDDYASVDPFVQIESANVIPQTSTSTSFHPNPQYVHAQFTFPLSSIPLPPVSISNSQTTLPYELTNVEASPMPIKHEIEAATALIENGQSMNQNIANLYEEDDEEDECDCDDCVNGGIDGIKQEDDDSVELIEDEEDREQSPSRPVKRPRLDTIQPNNAQPKIQPNQVNNHDKKIITLSLQCPHSGCSDTFPEDQLKVHTRMKHFYGLSRCLVKNCGQTFATKGILRNHIKNVHLHTTTTQWQCHKCLKHFGTYPQLSKHDHLYHQLGQFQCSFLSCTFTAECRVKVFTHQALQHSQILNCRHPGCHFQSPNASNLRVHERTHSGIKPYRCKWEHCDYASTKRSNTTDHIRRIHFGANARSVPNGAQLDPKDYLEVMLELL